MKVEYENHCTTNHELPEDFLSQAVDLRRRKHPQPYDGSPNEEPFDKPYEEMARIKQERMNRLPRISRGITTLALVQSEVDGEFDSTIGCFHAYVMGEENRKHRRIDDRQVWFDGLWLDPRYANAGVAYNLAESGLAHFRSDRIIANAREVMPVLLSGALDDHRNEGIRLPPEISADMTIEEARLAINAILAPETPDVLPAVRSLVTASI